MIAVIELENGDIQTRAGLSGRFADAVDVIVREVPTALMIWCVMDELGEEWDQNSQPYWFKGMTRCYRIFGPNGSGVIELTWDGDDFWEVLEREYPNTYELMDSCDGMEVVEEYDHLMDDEEAAELYRGAQ